MWLPCCMSDLPLCVVTMLYVRLTTVCGYHVVCQTYHCVWLPCFMSDLPLCVVTMLYVRLTTVCGYHVVCQTYHCVWLPCCMSDCYHCVWLPCCMSDLPLCVVTMLYVRLTTVCGYHVVCQTATAVYGYHVVCHTYCCIWLPCCMSDLPLCVFTVYYFYILTFMSHGFTVYEVGRSLDRDGDLKVIFCWVPSHIGIRGNVKADSAVKSALDLLVSSLVYPTLILNTILINIFVSLGKMIGMVRSRTSFILLSHSW